MTKSRRRPLIRLIACAMFALALVMQPMLVALGELHELTAHSVTEHAHLDVDQSAAEQSADRQATTDHGAESPSALHVLLHFAHCCGQMPALAVPLLLIATSQPPAPAPMIPARPRLDSGPAPTPFRPPITA